MWYHSCCGQRLTTAFSPKPKAGRRQAGSLAAPPRSTLFFEEQLQGESLSALAPGQSVNLKIHLKQNKTRGELSWLARTLGTFLNPLTYLFGRGWVPGEGREELITGLVSLISHCLPSTFTVIVFCPLQVGAGGRGRVHCGDLAPQSRWWQKRRKSCVCAWWQLQNRHPQMWGTAQPGNEVHDWEMDIWWLVVNPERQDQDRKSYYPWT